MGWVRWVLAYLTHDMGILVMQFEEVYQGKVNKYVNSNVASGTPWRHTTGFDTQQLHPQKSYECCHVCHVPKGNFQVCKNKQLKQPKKGENRGRPTTANQQRKIHIDIGLIYWYQLVKIPPPPPWNPVSTYVNFLDWNSRSTDAMIQMIRWNPEGLIRDLFSPGVVTFSCWNGTESTITT